MVAGVTHKALITWPLFSLILVSVSFSALAQISLKHGMSVPGVQTALADGGTTTIALAVASSPMVWVGLFLTASAPWYGSSFWLASMFRWPMHSWRWASF
jgi:hypothetical protein